MLRKLVLIFFFGGAFSLLVGGIFLTWGYHYITRDLPRLTRIEDYQPAAVSSVYAADGTLIAEFFAERRYPAKLREIPLFVRNCFLAAEDAGFYSHPGIDLVSILRAFVKNLQTGSVKQGGSTITQQVVKNLLLSSERKLTRKIKEAILSYQIEQRLSKDDILEIYLNQIYFGNGAYGIKAASRAYFHKEPSELSLAEASMLAGLPKAPSRYSPVASPERAKARQEYVLRQMVKAGFITTVKARAAKQEEVEARKSDTQNIFHAPYFVSEVRRNLLANWRDLDIDRGGFEIHTTVDLKAEEFAQQSIRRGVETVDRRQGWRGPIERLGSVDTTGYQDRFAKDLSVPLRAAEVYPALVRRVYPSQHHASILVGEHEAVLDLKSAAWARKMLNEVDNVRWAQPEKVLRPGDVIEVLASESTAKSDTGNELQFELAQTPLLEGAMLLLDPNSGRVRALIGGYNYARSQFNRVTQSFRQPGSAFKPIVYLAAVDGFSYTPATIVHDVPRKFRVGDEYWEPGNFDQTFLGPITLRSALEKSRNVVSADIVSRIGVDAVIQYARKLGLTSPLGRNPSISLGSSEVTLLELARAYGVIASGGVLFESVFVERIADRNGEVIFQYEDVAIDRAREVIPSESAFIMANMMKGVVQRGTGWRVRELERPAAGKTGTSNDLMDAWFLGYTPEWVCGVWVGFDLKKTIGDKETGGRVSSPIWLDFMSKYLEYQDQRKYQMLVEAAQQESEELSIEYVAPEKPEPLDFSVPDGVDPSWIDRQTGWPTDAENPDAVLEYFVKGTEPTSQQAQQEASSYLSSPDL